MSSFHSGISDIKRRKFYDLEKILDDKLLVVFGMNYDELTTFFGLIDIISWEEVIIHFKQNSIDLIEISELFYIYNGNCEISFEKEATNVIQARKSDYNYYKKYINILKKKGLEILKLLKYLSLKKLDNEDMNETILKLGIKPDFGIDGKTFTIILRTLFVIYNDLSEKENSVNNYKAFEKPFINDKNKDVIEQLYPSEELLIVGKYDRTSIRVRRY